MREEKVVYKCDRCGAEIDELIFTKLPYSFKKIISATQYEITKQSLLTDELNKIPDADVVVLEGVVGYFPSGFKKIHLCKKCSKEFKKFMKN